MGDKGSIDTVLARICAAGMLAAVPLFFFGNGVLATALALIVFSLCSALYMPAMTIYAAELFTPQVRSQATSFAWLANRIVAVGAPLILIPLVRHSGSAITAAILGGALVINIAVLSLLAPGEADPAAGAANPG